MNILVLYTTFSKRDRNIMTDSLLCFRQHVKGHHFHYLDVQRPQDLPEALARTPFDAVIFHLTFLARKYDSDGWRAFYAQVVPVLRALPGPKAIIPHDEFTHTDALRDLVRDCGVKYIFTGVSPDEYEAYYGEALAAGAECHTVFTGYISEKRLAVIERLRRKNPVRDIDISYRARALPYWFGQHGHLKIELAERFNDALGNHPEVRADIANTGDKGQNEFLGDDWLRFLLRSRTALGSLGGSSLMDADGNIAKRTNAYCAEHPGAAFDEVAAACFDGRDGQVHTYLLGPRHFECAMTKTCQVLVEGDYQGVFLPGVHYIEVKRDYSNLDAVIEKMMDPAYCERLAEQCYQDIVAGPGTENPYTYASFANLVADTLLGDLTEQGRSFGQYLACAHMVSKIPRRYRRFVAMQNLYLSICRFFERHPAALRFAKRFIKRDFMRDRVDPDS